MTHHQGRIVDRADGDEPAGSADQRRSADAAAAAVLREEISEIAKVAGHDLIEPLTVIVGYTKLLEEQFSDRLGSDGQQIVGGLRTNATRLRTRLGVIRDYLRLQPAEDPEKVDLGELVGELVESMSEPLSRSGARVETGPLTVVEGDRALLRRLLTELIDNAITHRGECPPLITVAASPVAEGWKLEVADNGPGIDDPAAATALLGPTFDPMRDGGGAGLAFCRKIARLHGGSLRIDSTPAGTTVRVTLAVPDASVGREPEPRIGDEDGS